MTRKQKLASSGIGIVITCLVCIFVVTQVILPDRDSTKLVAQQAPNKDSSSKVVVGGISRPKSDVSNSKGDARRVANRPKVLKKDPVLEKNGPDGYGLVPTVDPAESETVADAVRKLKEKGARPGSTLRSKEFDAKAFNENPKKYVDEFDPFRVFNPAQPGEGVPVLVRASKKQNSIKQGEVVALSVKAPHRTPVTFTSFDGGTFTNKLPSICVLADDKGIARADFVSTTGVVSGCKVLASSPMTTGVVDFQIGVARPASMDSAVR